MKTLLKGKVKQIVVRKYYNLDGTIIDEGTDTTNFDVEKDFEITSKRKQIYGYRFDWWTLTVDGEAFGTEFEITKYKLDGDRLLLHGCTGAG